MITTPLSRDTDRDLIDRTLAGDERAFRELVDHYGGLVYNLIHRMTRNLELAEEVTQEVFVNVYRKLDTFDRRRPFKPWVLRIASNATVSALRRERRVISLDELQESGHFQASEPLLARENTADRVENRLSSEIILNALAELDAKYREALLLRYKEELSYEEIAHAMDVPINTVRTWLKRGREVLKQHVKGLLDE